MRSFYPTAHALSVNRRAFLTHSAYGLGGLAFAMLAGKASGATSPGLPKPAGWNTR
jgi:hypothetical protein